MTYSEIAKKIVELVGTDENITSIMNCMTRLRISTIDRSKIDVEGLKQVEKVKGVVLKGNTVQIVLLGELGDIYAEVEKLVTIKEHTSTEKVKEKITVGYIVGVVMDYISGTMVPILPALIACGLLQGIMVAINQFGWLDPESSTHQILTLLSNTTLYYFPVLIAFSAARKIKCNPYIAAVIAGFIMHPTFIEWANAGLENFNFFGLPVYLMAYNNNVFPMLISVWVIKLFEVLFNKVMPKSLKTTFTPFFTLICSAPIIIVVTAPLGGYLANAYSTAFTFLMTHYPILTGAVFGATGSLLVLVGLHVLNMNFTLMNIGNLGYDFIWPILKFSTNILGGLALGAWLKVKNKEDKAYALSAWALACFGGLSEPSLYGVVVRYKRPMIPMIVLGTIVGMISVASGVTTYAVVGGSWLISIPAFLHCLPQYLLCIAICNIGGAIIGYVWGYEEPGSLPAIIENKLNKKNG